MTHIVRVLNEAGALLSVNALFMTVLSECLSPRSNTRKTSVLSSGHFCALCAPCVQVKRSRHSAHKTQPVAVF